MVLTLDEIENRCIPIAIKHGVNSLGIFGSYSRNDATEESDLDFRMDDGKVNSLTKYFSLVMFWRKNLNVMLICFLQLVTIKNF